VQPPAAAFTRGEIRAGTVDREAAGEECRLRAAADERAGEQQGGAG